MNLAKIRALIKSAGYKTTDAVDRVSIRYDYGKPIGIDVMFTSGTVDYIAAPAED